MPSSSVGSGSTGGSRARLEQFLGALGQLLHEQSGGVVAPHMYRLRTHKFSFEGSKLVTWLVEQRLADSREDAVTLCSFLASYNVFAPIADTNVKFEDNGTLYVLDMEGNLKPRTHSTSSLVSEASVADLEAAAAGAAPPSPPAARRDGAIPAPPPVTWVDASDTKLEPLQIGAVLVSIVDASTVSPAGRSFTIYRIRIGSGQYKWEVERRYKQFETLYNVMVKRTSSLPAFPGKTYLSSSTDPAVVEGRKRSLQAFLNTAAALPQSWQCDEFISFLDNTQRTLHQQYLMLRHVRCIRFMYCMIGTPDERSRASVPDLPAARREVARLMSQGVGDDGGWGAEDPDEPIVTPDEVLRGTAAVQPAAAPVIRRAGSETRRPPVAYAHVLNSSPILAAKIPGPLVDDGRLRSTSDASSRSGMPGAPPLPPTGPAAGGAPPRSSPADTPRSGTPMAEFDAVETLTMIATIARGRPDVAAAMRGRLPRTIGERHAVDVYRVLCDRLDAIFGWIRPTVDSDSRRKAVFALIARSVRSCLGAHCFPMGSFPLKTYLPSGDIDLSAFLCSGQETGWAMKLTQALVATAEENTERQSPVVQSVQFINAEVRVVRCVLDNISVDISANRGAALVVAGFLERFNHLVGQEHLFKRSVLLLKAWCSYETERFTHVKLLDSYAGTFSSWALQAMLVSIFNSFHSRIFHPLEALALFFHYYASFGWEADTVTVDGPMHTLSRVRRRWEGATDDFLLTPDMMEPMRAHVASAWGPGTHTFEPRDCNILDPLCDWNNLSRTVTRVGLQCIQQALATGHARFLSILNHMYRPPATGEAPSAVVADEVDDFYQRTWGMYGTGDRWRNDLLSHPRQECHRGPVVSLPAMRPSPSQVVPATLNGNLEGMWEAVAYSEMVLAHQVTPQALVALTARILADHGPVPVGEIGKLLQEATGNKNLPQVIKEQFGGLKKFLEANEHVFTVGDDHQFNPHVHLRAIRDTSLDKLPGWALLQTRTDSMFALSMQSGAAGSGTVGAASPVGAAAPLPPALTLATGTDTATSKHDSPAVVVPPSPVHPTGGRGRSGSVTSASSVTSKASSITSRDRVSIASRDQGARERKSGHARNGSSGSNGVPAAGSSSPSSQRDRSRRARPQQPTVAIPEASMSYTPGVAYPYMMPGAVQFVPAGAVTYAYAPEPMWGAAHGQPADRSPIQRPRTQQYPGGHRQ